MPSLLQLVKQLRPELPVYHCLSSDLQLDEAARVIAVGLQRVLLVQGPQDRVGFVAEGLRVQAAEVEAQVVQQKLHGDLRPPDGGVHHRRATQDQGRGVHLAAPHELMRQGGCRKRKLKKEETCF